MPHANARTRTAPQLAEKNRVWECSDAWVREGYAGSLIYVPSVLGRKWIPCCASRHLGLFRASSCHLIQSGAGRKYHPAILVQAPIAVKHCNHSRTGLSPTLSLSLCIDSMLATSGEKSVHVIYVDGIKTSLKDGCFTSATPPGNPSISSKPRLYAAVSGDGGVRNTGHKTLRISQFHVGWIDTERERSTVTTRLGLHA